MKVTTLVSTVAFALGASAIPAENNRVVENPQDWQAQPQGMRIIPKLSQQPIIDGAQRREILYGPYSLGAGDMMSTYQFNQESPCSDCYVTGMSVTLKWPDRREATVEEGIWLHHCLMTQGLTRLISNSAAPITPGIIWAAANERPTLRLNSKYRYGIDWPSVFSFTLDLASERKQDTDIYLSITYEYVPKSSPQGQYYRGTIMHWNTIGDPLDIPEGKTSYGSGTWRIPVNGKLLWTSGHVHDGGTVQVLYVNGRPVCNSTQFYTRNADTAHSMHSGGGRKGTQKQSYYGPYAQQQSAPGYSQQEAYPQVPQQPAYPQQAAPAYPQQDAYPQQAAYPQAPEQQAYPQQAYDQQANAYSQQQQQQQPSNNYNGQAQQYNWKRQMHGNSFGGDHIESPGACTDFGDVRVGDRMTTRAFYDMTIHKGMTHKGEEERVMGNMRVFIGPTD